MKPIKGCAFLCDFNGTIKQILRDDFEIASDSVIGNLFTSLLENESESSALDLMMEVRENNIAFDYRLSLLDNNKLKSIYFLGVNLHKYLLFVGADNHHEAVEFTNHLQTINNEQSNFIRTLLKEKSQKWKEKEEETQQLLEELTQVNNELINLQRQLNKKNKELENLNDIKNKFLGIASHDLRNPLSVVQMYSTFLLEEDEKKLAEEQHKFASIIHKSAKYMIGLVNDLLEYSKIESGTIQLNKEKFDLVSVVEGIVNLMKPIAAKKQISLRFNSDKPHIQLLADMFKIEQVINNLLGNAIKFSYQKTTINVSMILKNNTCIISVSNKGDGIEEKDSDKVFKPFQKIAARGTAKEAGSGLGLFIVKQIVDNHKGKIWFKSKPKDLTTFFIELPLDNLDE